MSTVARLTNEGDLLINGEVNERLPSVVNSLVEYYPFDDSVDISSTGELFRDFEKEWKTDDFIDAKVYPVRINGSFPTIVLEAEVYIDSVPTERYTVLQARHQSGSIYLSIDNLLKVSVYSHLKGSAGYHVSNATLSLNKWYKITHIHTKTETIIMIDDVVDFSLVNNSTQNAEVNGVFIGAENTNRHMQGSIRNMKVSITDPRIKVTNIDAITSSDGVIISEGTTNLSPQDMTTWTINQGCTVTKTNNYYQGMPVYRVFFPKGNLPRAYFDFNYLANESFSGSVYYRYLPDSVGTGEMLPSIFFRETGFGTVHKSSQLNETIEWKRHSISNTFSVGGSSMFLLYRSSNATTKDITIEFCMPQLEKKPFSTSFTNGSRNSGRVDIPFKLKPPYSINFFHKSHKPLSTIVDQNTSPMILQLGTYYANASFSLWNFSKVLRTYIKGDISTGWTGTGTSTFHNFTDADWDNVEHMYTIVAIDNRSFKIYMDGVYKGTSTSSEDVTNITYLSMGNAYMPNASYRDMSVYDVALTDESIAKLFSKKTPVSSTGEVTITVKEKHLYHSKYQKYFPLNNSGSDDYDMYTPVLDTANYQNGMSWCGRETINLLYDNGVFNSSFNNLTLTPTVTAIETNYRYRIETNNTTGANSIRFKVPNTKLVNGQTYTMSYKYKILRGSRFNMGDWCDSPITSKDTNNGEYRYQYAYGVRATYDATYSFMDIIVDPNSIIEVWDIQLEQTNFPTPFTNGTRGKTSIEYSPSILNVNSGAIMGWWKFDENARSYRGVTSNGTNYDNDFAMLFSTYEGSELNKLNIRSLYSNPSGYWATSVSSSTTSAPTINFTVQDGWHMVALCWDKTNSKLKLLVDGKLISEITTTSLPDAFNSPLRIGDWSGGTSPWGSANMYAKDLIILDKYPTNEEVADMYKTKMSNKDGSLYIQGQIKEGVML